MNTHQRIGIVEPGIDGWVAGSKYISMLAHSLGNACQAAGAELFVFCRDKDPVSRQPELPAKTVVLAKPRNFRGEGRLRKLLGLSDRSDLSHTARLHHISVLLPLLSVPRTTSALKTIGWIPDFQHVYLPEFFSETECRTRDTTFRLLAERAALVMVNSHNALEHLVAFAPKYAAKGRVTSFPSLLAFKSPQGDALSTQRKFNLPAKFALVANQFWRHKNHQVVIDAISHLARKGIAIPVVMTGLPADYRDPNNHTVSRVLQAIATAGLVDQITVLGLVSDPDLVNLMRTAAVVIQPSRFEGWSSVVQDCKALGRPLICSDIPVHREQASEALGFFASNNADALADLLAASWAGLQPGPCLAAEERALAREREFARLHGLSLLRICQEAECA